MDSLGLAHHNIDNVSFSVYSAAEVKSLAVFEVTNVETFDALGHPANGGLCDNALGNQGFFETFDASFD